MPDTPRNAPLYQALAALAADDPLRLNVPGHHGAPVPGFSRSVFSLDFTEHPALGDLYQPGGAVSHAGQLWADWWRMPACQMLTGGSTQGIHAALLAACKPGDTVLIDRACHRAVYNAMALLDLNPRYLLRDMETPITRAMLADALQCNPEVKTICITSPTYYGILSELPRFDGVTRIVDAAHGAHLPLLSGMDGYLSAADLAVTSVHKTLPALGQSALLLSNGRFDAAQLRRAAAVVGTSSPSFPMLASMDLARDYCARGWADGAVAAVCAAFARLRVDYPALCAHIDPMRLTLRVQDGFAVERALAAFQILPELVDRHHVVFIGGVLDGGAALDRLAAALAQIPAAQVPAPVSPPVPPPPEVVLTPRGALFCAREMVSLRQSAGRVAAEHIAPCPPGVPVVAPGERITEKHLAYLAQIGYNLSGTVAVAAQESEKGGRTA